MAAVYLIAKVLPSAPTSTRALDGFVNFIVPEPPNACVRPPVISLLSMGSALRDTVKALWSGLSSVAEVLTVVTNRDGSIGDADFIAFVYLTDVDRYPVARNVS